MRRDFKTSLLTVGLIFLFSSAGFSEYARLVGKRVEIHGPDCWQTLGMAVDEEAGDWLIKASRSGSKKIFNKFLSSFRIRRFKKNAKALVLDTKIMEGKAKVVLFGGIYKGIAGWIPIEWLNGNEQLPRLNKIP